MHSPSKYATGTPETSLRIVVLGDELSATSQGPNGGDVSGRLCELFRHEGLTVHVENLSRPHATAENGLQQVHRCTGSIDLAVVNFGLNDTRAAWQPLRTVRPLELARRLWQRINGRPVASTPTGASPATCDMPELETFRQSIRQIVEALRQHSPAATIVLWAPYLPVAVGKLERPVPKAKLMAYARSMEDVARQSGCYWLATDLLEREIGTDDSLGIAERNEQLQRNIAEAIFYLAGDAAFWNRRTA